jgi:hypothetical protein
VTNPSHCRGSSKYLASAPPGWKSPGAAIFVILRIKGDKDPTHEYIEKATKFTAAYKKYGQAFKPITYK